MDSVFAAFRVVPREGFLRPESVRQAGFDGPLEIGHGQTNSQPATVREMLRLLKVQPGDRVLDVGSGSGWTTALLAHLTGPSGRVYGVELEPELAVWGAANLARHDFPWASIQEALPGVLGLPDLGPYDRILVSADPRVLPLSLVEQLADPGRMVIPVSSTMLTVDREGGETVVREHGAYRFVPLR